MARTTIYLDIDGVVNLMVAGHPELAGWTRQEQADTGFVDVVFHPGVIAGLNALAAREDTEIVFASTWRSKAVSLEATGLDCRSWRSLSEHIPGQGLDPEVAAAARELAELGFGDDGEDWKAAAMLADRHAVDPEGTGRFVFIEDQPFDSTRRWLESTRGASWLSTAVAHGLRPEHLRGLEAVASAMDAARARTAQLGLQSLSVPDQDQRRLMEQLRALGSAQSELTSPGPHHRPVLSIRVAPMATQSE